MRASPSAAISPWSKATTAGVLAVVVGVLAWLWPIGIGGKMLVGGDVTQFFLGLMGVLAESLRAGRLAVWNDLWGYGFPGLAESQMGVFYPVHVVLYRWLNTETAYVASLVIHTLWGGLGAFWAARRLGTSAAGAALAAFSWSTCGFFLIHLAHPWSYTTGSWMPWAWGLAWCILAEDGAASFARPILLSLVLVLQVLPGHFQLAFMTQAGILVMIVWAAIENWGWLGIGRLRAHSVGPALSFRRAGGVGLALAAVFPLGAIQLWPTSRLADLAAAQRDFDYLSGFASTPFHLVNYLAPGLFHRSPLWRPLVWDPFHTSPEEHLAYIGLVPFLLAVMAVLREWRRDGAVRLLTVTALVSLLLSLGPYAPGFRLLIMLPGFSFFRAPSRWSLATALALALLAGKGFDRWRDWTRPGRSLRRFVFAAVFWVCAVVGLMELAIACTAAPAWPAMVQTFERAFRIMPWTGDPSFETVLAQARKPPADGRVILGLPQAARSFADERSRIYAAELWESAVLVFALIVVAGLNERGRLGPGAVKCALILFTFLDLWVLGRHRLIGVGPIRPLTEQSPVLARLAQEPRGTRIAYGRLAGFGNLPMLIGMAPIAAYRTLDLPVVSSLTSLAQGPLSDPRVQAEVTGALRATGTGMRVFDPLENRLDHVQRRTVEAAETIEDATLASWLWNESMPQEQGAWARTFKIRRAPARPVRAWLVPSSELLDTGLLDEWSGDPREILVLLEGAQGLDSASSRPDELSIPVNARDPAWVVISQLADPQWKAVWIDFDGQREIQARIFPTFRRSGEPGGWQRVSVPEAGRWTLRLEYDAGDVAEGLAISTLAWAAWMAACVFTAIRAARGRFMTRRAQAGEVA